MREYRLYGEDDACLLSARIKGTRMLPRLVELDDGQTVVARISRKGLLGRDLLLDDLARHEQLRLDLPVITSATRTRPFDVLDRQGQVAWRLAPPSGLKDRPVLDSAMMGALFDSELVLLAGGEVVGATRPSRDPDGPWPDGPLGILQFISRAPRQIARLAAEAKVRPSSDAEVPIGKFVQQRDEARLTPALIMLILLFRRFDYDFMRDVS